MLAEKLSLSSFGTPKVARQRRTMPFAFSSMKLVTVNKSSLIWMKSTAIRNTLRSRGGLHVVEATSSSTRDPPTGLKIMEWTGDNEQVAALNQLKEKMMQTEYAENVTEEQLRWFLLDRKLDTKAAKDKLCSMLKWRSEFGYVLSFPMSCYFCHIGSSSNVLVCLSTTMKHKENAHADSPLLQC